jgi:ComF family protein
MDHFCVKCTQSLSDTQFSSQTFFKERLTIYSIYDYEGVVRCLVRQLKFNLNKDIAGHLNPALLVELGVDISQFSRIIFVPSHLSRNFKRGFKANEVLLQALLSYSVTHSSELELKRVRSVRRIKRTPHFYLLDRHARFSTIRNVFNLSKESVKDMSVLLLDDVSTTGATLLELASLCYKLGAKHVTGLALAKEK